MIRRYCDRCGVQIGDSAAHNRIKRELYAPAKILTVEIHVAWNRSWNSGDICTACVLEAVVDGKDIDRYRTTYVNTEVVRHCGCADNPCSCMSSGGSLTSKASTAPLTGGSRSDSTEAADGNAPSSTEGVL